MELPLSSVICSHAHSGPLHATRLERTLPLHAMLVLVQHRHRSPILLPAAHVPSPMLASATWAPLAAIPTAPMACACPVSR